MREMNSKKYKHEIQCEQNWRISNPYGWNRNDVLMWMADYLYSKNYNLGKMNFNVMLIGSELINQGYEFFYRYSTQHYIDLFQDLHLEVSSWNIDYDSNKPSSTLSKKRKNICDFIFECLESNSGLIEWIDRIELKFKIIQPKLFASLWGKIQNNEKMTYQNMTRTIRYHYDKDLLPHHKKLVYKFNKNSKIIQNSNASKKNKYILITF